MLIDIMTYIKAQIKWKRSHVLTTCNDIKMPVRIAACKLPQNRANMALTFFSPFITTQKKLFIRFEYQNTGRWLQNIYIVIVCIVIYIYSVKEAFIGILNDILMMAYQSKGWGQFSLTGLTNVGNWFNNN